MYDTWTTKIGTQRRRFDHLNQTAVLLLYAFAFSWVAHAGVVKRDISHVTLAPVAANATTENPPTIVETKHENGVGGVGDHAINAAIIKLLETSNTANATRNTDSSENSENAIAREENSRERGEAPIFKNNNSTDNVAHHVSLYDHEDVAGNYDDVDESLGTRNNVSKK